MSVVIVGVIRRKPVLTHASIVCEGMLASVNSVKMNIVGATGRQFELDARRMLAISVSIADVLVARRRPVSSVATRDQQRNAINVHCSGPGP